MLPRLQAEERLNAINDRAVAFGSADRDQTRRTFDRLEKDARVQRPAPQPAGPSILASMGIGMVGAAAASEEALSDG